MEGKAGGRRTRRPSLGGTGRCPAGWQTPRLSGVSARGKKFATVRLSRVNAGLHCVGVRSIINVKVKQRCGARASGDAGRLVRQSPHATLKGHADFLLSYFQVLDIFVFTMAAAAISITIPLPSAERQLTNPKGSPEPGTHSPRPAPAHPGHQGRASAANHGSLAHTGHTAGRTRAGGVAGPGQQAGPRRCFVHIPAVNTSPHSACQRK